MIITPIDVDTVVGTKTAHAIAAVGDIAVDVDAYTDNYADATNIIFAKENWRDLIMQISNSTNSIDYEIRGRIDTPDLTAPVGDGWNLLPNGMGTIGANGIDALVLSDFWTHILIRLKETTSGSAGAVDFNMRATN